MCGFRRNGKTCAEKRFFSLHFKNVAVTVHCGFLYGVDLCILRCWRSPSVPLNIYQKRQQVTRFFIFKSTDIMTNYYFPISTITFSVLIFPLSVANTDITSSFVPPGRSWYKVNFRLYYSHDISPAYKTKHAQYPSHQFVLQNYIWSNSEVWIQLIVMFFFSFHA